MSYNKPLSYYILDEFSNIWIFTYTTNHEIKYEIYNNKKEKIHSAILANKCMNDFILYTGKQHDIHIVIRKISGEILYHFFNGQKWSVQKLFDLRESKDSFYLLGLCIWKNNTHILY